MLNPGTYQGQIIGYGITLAATGAPRATIKFQVGNESVYWAGTLVGGGIDITLKGLITCGLRSPDDLEKIAEGPAGAILDMKRTYELVVEHEQSGDKTYAKVKFINDGTVGGDKAIDRAEFAREIITRNLKGDVARLLAGKPKADIPF